MTPYKQGDIVLVPFPFTDLTTTKKRPAVIISSERFNKKYNDVIVVAITSQIPESISEEEILLSPIEQKESGLPKTSLIKIGKISTIDQRLIRKKLGTIPRTTYKKLIDAIDTIIV
ncbi:MAG: hypothetical protein A3I11_07645 [Elusimicrobia bacterium RIFCSPLOWO2_02_FULL_39_32]|nr:MAG: hypothetical protein A2034_01280 [Elusimicrobia bacterium GWA2_38_7]OGR79745.1 MAG: hypothetical protein A3B80_01055 [Elusimicrobia bacterium RIFCSPHIGHO2_02_FULL_39_36]OGR92058.1 MAG: hypothetical protein A3I11_07645 [Elusimicrobia bacterium RIFCSPLOWO2_02_FULL_39_32]OGR98652.1 MAG: hypothetical protein A3G85_04785 [Elusimicrobia bacterium RIFCSPLOWO2_12_FULL_39_28]HLD79734.1 type II toxin-antitoxin system PemK/MazF family toxin [Candidatus Nanoarchaeia archaeon]